MTEKRMKAFNREQLLQRLHRSADASANDIEDMKELIGMLPDMRNYIDTTPQYDPERRFVLDCCCDVMEFVYSYTKNNDTLANLNALVRMNHTRLQSTPKDESLQYAEALINFAHVLERSFRKRGSLNPGDDLNKAIDATQQAVALCPNHPNHFHWLLNLGELLRKRSEQKSSIDDIHTAIQYIEKATVEAVKDPSKDDDDMGRCFESHGKALQAKSELTISFVDVNDADSELTSSLAAMKDAIVSLRKAVKYKSRNESEIGGTLSNLGNALLRHFERTHSMEELGEAIRILDEGVKCTPDDHYELPARINNLSNAYSCRFDHKGVIADLNMCVQLNSKAVSIARETEGHPDLPECLVIFGENLQMMSNRMGSKEDLEEAIRVLTEAESLLHKDNPQRAICLSSLGSAFGRRAEQTKSLYPQQSKMDFAQGIKLQKDAVLLTSEQNPNWPVYMTKLGNALSSQIRKGDSTEDVDACIKAHEAAIKRNRNDPLFHGLSLINYGNSLILRFQITEDMKDLDSAIKTHHDAIQIIPEDHPYNAIVENNLGSYFSKRFHHSQKPEDMQAAIDHHAKAFMIPSTTPSLRIGAVRDAARLRLQRRQLSLGDFKQATRLLKEAVELLPMTSPMSLQRSDQQDALARFSGLARSAAALTLHSNGTPFEALRLLELGRGVMASLQLDTRTDISSLAGVDSRLADQFRDLRDQLDSPQLNGVSNSHHTTAPSNKRVSLPERHTVLERFNKVVEKIRQQGQPDFLKGPTEEYFTSLAEDGPIVVFNVDINRSDVFIVTGDGIKALQLPELHYEKVKLMAKQSRRVVNAREAVRMGTVPDDDDESSTMDEVLKWLWDAAVGRILADLKSSNALEPPKSGELPHVWWITSGWLSLLPVHAAGCHAHNSKENALDLVISSYAPTIKSLGYAREKETRISNEPCKRALLVSMKETDGQNSLPGAQKEVSSINSILPASITCNFRQGDVGDSEYAVKDTVMPALGNCHICHFACHGESHPSDPSLSKLLLADWKSNPLSVNDIVALKPEHAKLAYLSACSVADSRVEALLDESIHLMSAFLIAGYPSIVGTLWQIRDLLSVDVATSFYGSICEGGEIVDVKRSASALNRTIRDVRDRTATEFDSACSWAPYIHIGV